MHNSRLVSFSRQCSHICVLRLKYSDVYIHCFTVLNKELTYSLPLNFLYFKPCQTHKDGGRCYHSHASPLKRNTVFVQLQRKFIIAHVRFHANRLPTPCTSSQSLHRRNNCHNISPIIVLTVHSSLMKTIILNMWQHSARSLSLHISLYFDKHSTAALSFSQQQHPDEKHDHVGYSRVSSERSVTAIAGAGHLKSAAWFSV